jgi:predicted nuclease of predicted toxin-antitoxin system
MIISADTDFGELVSRSNASQPSIVLFRRQGQRRSSEIALLLLANLPTVVEDLETGPVVVLDENRIRIRQLPMRPD